MKTCTKCGCEKELTEFSKNIRAKDGHKHTCKACSAAERKVWKGVNPEKVLEGRRRYSEKHKETVAAKSRGWRERNPERFKELKRAWGARNPERVKAIRNAPCIHLYDAYLVAQLGAGKDATPEIIAMKREQLTYLRLAREIKTKLKEETK